MNHELVGYPPTSVPPHARITHVSHMYQDFLDSQNSLNSGLAFLWLPVLGLQPCLSLPSVLHRSPRRPRTSYAVQAGFELTILLPPPTALRSLLSPSLVCSISLFVQTGHCNPSKKFTTQSHEPRNGLIKAVGNAKVTVE